jgi:hypothetical protein
MLPGGCRQQARRGDVHGRAPGGRGALEEASMGQRREAVARKKLRSDERAICLIHFFLNCAAEAAAGHLDAANALSDRFFLCFYISICHALNCFWMRCWSILHVNLIWSVPLLHFCLTLLD